MNQNSPTNLVIPAIAFGILFFYLAIPALFVIGPAKPLRGLLWASSITTFSILTCVLGFSGQFRRVIIATVVILFALTNVMLSISFITQGHALNTAFFTHLDISTLAVAWNIEREKIVGAFVYVTLAPVIAIYCAGRVHPIFPSGKWSRIAAYFLILATVLTHYPITSFVQHFMSTRVTSARMLAELDRMGNGVELPTSTTSANRNLVLIYLEGLEQNYLNTKLFPNLTPFINQMQSQSYWFANVHQFPGTSWTIGGMVSSQCGVPLLTRGKGNRILNEIDNPLKEVTCLAEFLSADGYQTAYIGGAALGFAGKGRFLKDNGFHTTLVIDELPTSVSHTWGMYDSVLFENSVHIFDALATAEQPFLLSLLTLDTHNPIGHPSPDCPSYADGKDEMLNAVHCTDALLREFFEHIRISPAGDNTVIALVSDHLLISGNMVDKLSQRPRRITFLVNDPDQQGGRYDGPSTHFDIAPTLLDALGKPDAKFFFGHSLLRNKMGLVFKKELSNDDFLGFSIEALIEQANEN